VSLDNAKSWLNTLMPLAREAGPVMTLAMAIMLVISSWWFAGWLRECADRNRVLATELVSQQKEFHHEMRLLINCAKGSNP
jgi:hypothetical protein